MDIKIDLERLERQARLSISQDRRDGVREELHRILEFASVLGDSCGDPAPDTRRSVLREDGPVPSMPREELLQNAPVQRDGCVLLPRVIEEERDNG